MRVVVSGTHASGKSTLVGDFARRHPGHTVLADPFESLDETFDAPDAASFAAQLRVAADRLVEHAGDADLIAERGPIDFLAYLVALSELAGLALDDAFLDRARARTAAAMATVDLLFVLPLNDVDRIHVGNDEHLALRTAMDAALLDLVDDPEVIGDRARVVEITGDFATRLAMLEASAGLTGHG